MSEYNEINPVNVRQRDEFFKKIETMFEFKSKLSKMFSADIIKNFKDTYFYLFEKIERGELPVSEEYFGGNQLAENIYKKKYFLKDVNSGELIEEKAEDVFVRIASYVASVEPTQELREMHAENFYRNLYEGHFLPGGRVLAGAGDLYKLKTLANCFVSVIADDSLEGIYDVAYEAARTFSYGGGIGIDVSQLRPKESKVHNAADTSTGSVSFMTLYSMTSGLIGQEGRRGAMMLTIDVKHPDVLEFIKSKMDPSWTTRLLLDQIKMKGIDYNEEQFEAIKKTIIENNQVRFANISIKVSDEFMSAVEEQNNYGLNKILVYSKKSKTGPVEGISSDDENYSYGMSKKDIKDYHLLKSFDTVEELNSYLASLSIANVSKDSLEDVNNRDYYGDYVVSSDFLDYDIAIKYSGDFMTYYKSEAVGEIKQLHKARDIWNKFVEGNYKSAEPGLIFWSKMSKYSPSNYVGRPIACTNPCGEVPLEDGGACNLGSLNLARMVKDGYTVNAQIDWDKIKESVSVVTRFLDNVVWWNKTLNALEKQRNAAGETRRIGLGVMGIADMFNQLGLSYDSDEAIDLLEKVLNFMTQTAYKTSANLAQEKGSAPAYDYEKYKENPFFIEVLEEETKNLIREKGLRNVAIMSIAPTGTISNAITGFKLNGKNYMGVSGGIEPIFANYYTRRTETLNRNGGQTFFKVFHSNIQAYIDMKNLNEQVQNTNEDTLKSVLPPHFFRTAHKITPDMRVRIQGIAQKYIDHSISSTVNLAEDISPETISDIYLKAWKNGLKGITIYRDGSRYPVLSIEGEETEFQRFQKKTFNLKVGEENKKVNGDEVLVMPDGKLTTVYHAKKGGLL